MVCWYCAFLELEDNIGVSMIQVGPFPKETWQVPMGLNDQVRELTLTAFETENCLF